MGIPVGPKDVRCVDLDRRRGKLIEGGNSKGGRNHGLTGRRGPEQQHEPVRVERVDAPVIRLRYDELAQVLVQTFKYRRGLIVSAFVQYLAQVAQAIHAWHKGAEPRTITEIGIQLFSADDQTVFGTRIPYLALDLYFGCGTDRRVGHQDVRIASAAVGEPLNLR